MKAERTRGRPRAVVTNVSGLPVDVKPGDGPSQDDDVTKRLVVIFEKGMAEKEEAISQRNTVIAEKERLLAEKDAIIAQKDEAIAYRDRLIAERDKLIQQDLTPKAEAFCAFLSDEGMIDLRTAAKELDVPPNKFVEHLAKVRVIYKNFGGRYIPRQQFMERGYFKVRESVPSGGGKRKTTIWVTHIGLEFLRAVLMYLPMTETEEAEHT